MAYLGIGYNGPDTNFLKDFVEQNEKWLKGDSQPKFFGANFIVFLDSNTAREFVKKCHASAPRDTISIFPMEQPIESHNH